MRAREELGDCEDLFHGPEGMKEEMRRNGRVARSEDAGMTDS